MKLLKFFIPTAIVLVSFFGTFGALYFIDPANLRGAEKADKVEEVV